MAQHARTRRHREQGSRGENANSRTNFLGAANIGDAHKKGGARLDKEVVPEAAVRPSQDNSDYHVGRGGAGNEHIVNKDKAKEKKDLVPTGLADKLKNKIFGSFKK